MIRTALASFPRWSALALGLISALGFAPLGLWPLTLLAMAGVIALIAAAPSRKGAALVGWLFGLGHFALGNNWIATAFTYQANMPVWLGWIAVVLVASYLAVWPMAAALAAWHWRGRPAALILALAGAWIVCEWLRGWVFTGYAWNPLALVALGPYDWPGLAGASCFTGTYGLSGIVILLAGAWYVGLRRARLDGLGVALAALPVALTLMPFSGPAPAPSRSIAYTLVQPNIAQEVLNEPANFARQFETTASLSTDRRPAPAGPRLVLWPESGTSFYLRDGYPASFYEYAGLIVEPGTARSAIAKSIGPQSTLMTGTVDLIYRNGAVEGARNSVSAVDGRGDIIASYDKAHLVPYGEYLALRWLLEPLGVSRLVPGAVDFVPGPGPRTIDLGPLGKAGIQICYEIVFSGEVVDRANRPDYLFNPTNDGWFGAWGPPQHLAQARMRAIEEGLPVLRSTTSGISAVIDADGRVVRSVPRFVAGRLDGTIPAAHAATPFARLGNALPLVLAVVFLIASCVALRRTRR